MIIMIGTYILIGTYNLNLNPNLCLPTGMGSRVNRQIIIFTPIIYRLRVNQFKFKTPISMTLSEVRFKSSPQANTFKSLSH